MSVESLTQSQNSKRRSLLDIEIENNNIVAKAKKNRVMNQIYNATPSFITKTLNEELSDKFTTLDKVRRELQTVLNRDIAYEASVWLENTNDVNGFNSFWHVFKHDYPSLEGTNLEGFKAIWRRFKDKHLAPIVPPIEIPLKEKEEPIEVEPVPKQELVSSVKLPPQLPNPEGSPLWRKREIKGLIDSLEKGIINDDIIGKITDIYNENDQKEDVGKLLETVDGVEKVIANLTYWSSKQIMSPTVYRQQIEPLIQAIESDGPLKGSNIDDIKRIYNMKHTDLPHEDLSQIQYDEKLKEKVLNQLKKWAGLTAKESAEAAQKNLEPEKEYTLTELLYKLEHSMLSPRKYNYVLNILKKKNPNIDVNKVDKNYIIKALKEELISDEERYGDETLRLAKEIPAYREDKTPRKDKYREGLDKVIYRIKDKNPTITKKQARDLKYYLEDIGTSDDPATASYKLHKRALDIIDKILSSDVIPSWLTTQEAN
jgi:hypothetical protein